MKLGINIDHIAVLREARKINDPNPIDALGILKITNTDQVTLHLREDRRHINENDVKHIIALSSMPVNLECSLNDEIIKIVSKLKPNRATIVPEKREEVTTEGGLDVFKNEKKLKEVIANLQKNDIEVSLFINPEIHMVEQSSKLGANMIELHTGHYANVFAMLNGGLSNSAHCIKELKLSQEELRLQLKLCTKAIKNSARRAKELNLEVAAGHGLNYQNVSKISKIKEISELNIGQSIIARAIFTGLETAIKDMKKCLE